MVLGRRILQQLEHTEDVHKVMFEALVSEKTGAELRGMCDDQAGRDMKWYQEEAVALRNLCLSREQRAGRSVSARNQCNLVGRPIRTQTEKLSLKKVQFKESCKLGANEKALRQSECGMYGKMDSRQV